MLDWLAPATVLSTLNTLTPFFPPVSSHPPFSCETLCSPLAQLVWPSSLREISSQTSLLQPHTHNSHTVQLAASPAHHLPICQDLLFNMNPHHFPSHDIH